jgi:hypothetical protein
VQGEEMLKLFISDMMFDPSYSPLVYRAPGVGE